MAKVAELLPAETRTRFPRETLTARGQALLDLDIPDDARPAVKEAVTRFALNRLPSYTTTAALTRRLDREGAARIAASQDPERLAAAREEHFQSAPEYWRAIMQFGAAAKRALPGLGTSAGVEAIPAPRGPAENVASLAGGLTGFTAVAAPVTAITLGAGAPPLVAGALGAGTAGAAAPGTRQERIARGSTMAAASAGLSVLSGIVGKVVADRLASQAPKVASAIGREYEAAVRNGVARGLSAEEAARVAADGVRAKVFQATAAARGRQAAVMGTTGAVGGAAAFGVAQPLAERRALELQGQKPPPIRPSDYAESGLELLAVNLLLGGRSIARGATARPLRPAPEGGVSLAPQPSTRPPVTPSAPGAPAPTPAPAGPRLLPPAAVERAAMALPDNVRLSTLGRQAPREAFMQLAQSRIQSGESQEAAAAWAGEQVKAAMAIESNLRPPPVRPDQEALAQRGASATSKLQQAVESMGKVEGLRVVAPNGQTIRNAFLIPELSRLYPWADNQVRVTVADRESGTMFPLQFKDVQAFNQALQSGPEERLPAHPLRERVEALEAALARQPRGPKAEHQRRRVERMRGQVAADTKRQTEERQALERARTELGKRAEALRRQIAERPGDKNVGRWRRRLQEVEKQMGVGRAKATTPTQEAPEPEAAPQNVRAVGAEESPKPAPVAPPAAPPAPRAPVAPVAPTVPRETEGERVLVPDMLFGDETTAERVRAALERSTPDAEPTITRTRKGWQIEVNAAPAKSRLKKIPAAGAAPPAPAAGARVQPGAGPAPPPPAKPRATKDEREAAEREREATRQAAIKEMETPEGFISYYRRTHAYPSHRGFRMFVEANLLHRREGAPPIAGGMSESALVEKYEREHPVEDPGEDAPLPPAAPPAPKPAQPAPEAAVREPWEMTPEDWARHEAQAFGDEPKLPPSERAIEWHKGKVRDAMAAGKNVPAEVLALYPDLLRGAQEAAGQADMFGGVAMLGGRGSSGEPSAPAERPAVPTGEGPALEVTAPEAPSEAIEVRSQSVHRHPTFQQRETGAAELVRPENIQALLERAGGFNLEEIRRRPIIVWRDSEGRLGPAGRLYVIDGHHRLELAQHNWTKRDDGTWVKTGQADRDIPAVELHGPLEYATEQARVANLAGISNTYTEQARIAKEMRTEGKAWKAVASQLNNIGVGKAKRMAGFAELEKDVRETYFPPGREESVFGGVSHGEVLGEWVARAPKLMTPAVQNDFLAQAKKDAWTPSELQDQIAGWHEVMSAAQQESMGLGVGQVKIVMTPKQFAESVGRIQRRITELRYIANRDAKAMKSAEARAAVRKDTAAAKAFRTEVELLAQEAERLDALWTRTKPRLLDALKAEAQGGGSFDAALRQLKQETDAALLDIPPPPSTMSIPMGVFPANVGQWIWDMARRLKDEAQEPPIQQQRPLTEQEATVEEFLELVTKAEPKRAEQEQLYTEERGKRIGRSVEVGRKTSGEAGLEAELREHAGPLPKVEFEPLRGKFSQEKLDVLLEMIKASPRLLDYEKINARVALRDMMDGRLPQEAELLLLREVFGERIVTALAKKMNLDTGGILFNIGGLFKGLGASMDVSFGGRQGWAFMTRTSWRRGYRKGLEAWKSQPNYDALMETIYRDPDYPLARMGGVQFTDANTQILGLREEAFIGNWAERLHEPFELIPRIGKKVGRPFREWSRGVRASNRAYSAMGNFVRFLEFKEWVRLAREAGRLSWDPAKADPRLMRDYGKVVNTLTGRGGLGLAESPGTIKLLNFGLFSPRLMTSRFKMLDPSFYVNLPPGVRREVLKTMFASAMLVSSMLGLAWLAGAKVSLNVRDPDFGKIRFGNTVIDLGGGLLQFIRLYTEMAYHIMHRDAPGDALRTVGRFLHYKESPLVALIHGWLAGKGTDNKPFNATKEVRDLFIPMVARDILELSAEWDPMHPMTAFGTLASAHGAGVQVYAPRDATRTKPSGPRRPRRIQ